ncbi:MAG: glycosyltransferase family 39 protein [Planctomycetes bacterium]|nr:glycosyltransferase family 39 protein [Planctomycetota bacterium]
MQKPPLLYWLICASYELLGTNLVAARIWSVLCGVGLALIAARLHRELWRRDGTLAGLIVLSSVGVAIESRRAMLDLPMGCFVALAVLLGVRWRANGRTTTLVFAATALAAAALTKGPVAILFAGTAALAGMFARREARRPVRGAQLAIAALVFLALASPWPIAMWLQWPQLGDVIAEQSEARQFTWFRIEAIGPVIGGGLALIAPWSIAVVAAVVAGARRLAGDERREHRRLVLWVLLSAAPFLFFAAFERYLIPMVVPMATLAARLFDDASARARRTHLTIATALLAVPVLAGSAFTLWFGLAVVAPVAALVVLAWTLRAAWRSASPRRVALGCAATLTLLLGGVYPAIGINRLPDDLPADLASRDVATFQISQPGMLSMRTRKSVLALPEGCDLRTKLAGFDGYVFVLEDRAARFAAACESAGFRPEAVGSFRSLFSRKAWLRFVREGTTRDDWRAAFTERSLAALTPEFTVYRLRGG